MSGMSEILPYHPIKKLDEVPEIVGQYCYVLRDYPDDGFSLLLGVNEEGKLFFKFGDYDGNIIDLSKDHKYSKHIQKVLYEHMNKIVNLIGLVKLKMCQIYFAVSKDELIVADVRTHYDKFSSPGMIKDVISKAIGIPGPAVIKIDTITDELLDEISDGNYVIKPSYPKVIPRNEDIEPLRARI